MWHHIALILNESVDRHFETSLMNFMDRVWYVKCYLKCYEEDSRNPVMTTKGDRYSVGDTNGKSAHMRSDIGW